MPNPFPGMDPYLEGDLWMTVHTDLCSEIARQLSPKLRPKYLVRSTRRVVVALDYNDGKIETERYPDYLDVGIHSFSSPENASSAAATIAAPLVLDVSISDPVPHVSIEIRSAEDRRLVACIEVLSPTNKRGSGRDEYVAKRMQILSSPAHLMEIDLLRAGTRFPTVKPLPSDPYFVFISRAGGRKKAEVWPIALELLLPEVPVPLVEGDPDVKLDLQLALTTIYDIFGYDESLDYSQPPSGPLTPEQAKWVEERLREAGRRV